MKKVYLSFLLLVFCSFLCFPSFAYMTSYNRLSFSDFDLSTASNVNGEYVQVLIEVGGTYRLYFFFNGPEWSRDYIIYKGDANTGLYTTYSVRNSFLSESEFNLNSAVVGGTFHLDSFPGSTSSTVRSVLKYCYRQYLEGGVLPDYYVPPVDSRPSLDDAVFLPSVGKIANFQFSLISDSSNSIATRVPLRWDYSPSLLFDSQKVYIYVEFDSDIVSDEYGSSSYSGFLSPLSSDKVTYSAHLDFSGYRADLSNSWTVSGSFVSDNGFVLDGKNSTIVFAQHPSQIETSSYSVALTPVIVDLDSNITYFGITKRLSNIRLTSIGEPIYDFSDRSVSTSYVTEYQQDFTTNQYFNESSETYYTYNYEGDINTTNYDYSTTNITDVKNTLLPDVGVGGGVSLSLIDFYRSLKAALAAFIAFVPSLFVLFSWLPLWAKTLCVSVFVTFMLLGLAKFIFKFNLFEFLGGGD